MTETVVGRIRSIKDSLSRAESAIADLILADPGAAAESTISDLAQAAGTSIATVHRFCRTLELRGYAQLRLGLAADAEAARADSRAHVDLGSDIGPDDSLDQVVKKIGLANARAAEETAALIDVDVLRGVADLVQRARRIDLFSVGSSAIAAQDAEYKLLRLGFSAKFWPDVHAALMSAAVLRNGDLAVALSHSGRPREVADVLAAARADGAGTVLITSNPRCPAAQHADHVLLTSARETTFRSGGTASRTALLTVVDCLYVTLAQRSYEQTLADMERAHDAVRSRTIGRPRPVN
ncbi:MurR/RpiR family transcriptional regulator [Streptomyces sp. NPDC005151]